MVLNARVSCLKCQDFACAPPPLAENTSLKNNNNHENLKNAPDSKTVSVVVFFSYCIHLSLEEWG